MTTNKTPIIPMSPREVSAFAATWGSYDHNGDPGACMYGYGDDGRPQSERHREDTIRWVREECIPAVDENQADYDRHERLKLARFLTWIYRAPLLDGSPSPYGPDHTPDDVSPDPIDGELTSEELDAFLDAYAAAALWSSMDESDEDTGGEPMDANYSADDIDPATMLAMREDCVKFLADALPLIRKAEAMDAAGEWGLPSGAECSVIEYAGHDFWLTRNGHGCGFWDGDWPEAMEKKLTKLAEPFGDFNLYVGYDGKIYGS